MLFLIGGESRPLKAAIRTEQTKESFMTQDPSDAGSFTVKPNEKVTIKVQAVKVASQCSAALDGSACLATASNPVTFVVTAPPASGGNLNFVFMGTFPSPAPDGSMMKLSVEGDQGGGEFAGPILLPTNIDGSVDLDFGVQA